MTKNSAESKQRTGLYPRIGEYMWNKSKEKYNFPELSAESQANLEAANQALLEGTLVLYANHTSSKDAEVAVAVALSKLTNAKRFLGPAGMKHYDLKRNIQDRSINGILLRALRLLKVHVIPVVQTNDLESYTPEKRAKLITRLKQKTKRLFSKPGSVYGITPEGTRNKKTGELQKANTGIAKLEQYAPHNKPLTYLPLVITFDKFSEQPQVVIGKPLTLAEIIMESEIDVGNPQEIADMHMYRLAELQEEKLRGYYK